MNDLKKIFLCLAIISCFIPVRSYASDNLNMEIMIKYEKFVGQDEDFIQCGYTDCGLYFEIYGKQIDARALDGIFVTRTFVFEGMIQPESTVRLKEYINGEAYSGTLNLVSFAYNHDEMVTTAVYEGILSKRIE